MLNYGGILQAFALKEVVKKESKNFYFVENINFMPQESYYLSAKHKFISKFYQSLIVPIIKDRKRIQRTINFYNSYMFNEGYSSDKESVINYINKNIDKVIIGSDQVLNPFINNYCDLYLGKNITSKKYFYAASFGAKTIDKRWEKMLLDNVSGIKGISFRENTGFQIANRLNIEGRVDLDPTLLLSCFEWGSYVEKLHIKLPQKYIFCYIMPGNKKITSLIKKKARKISKQYKYKIVYCGQKDFMRFLEPFKNKSSYGPLEWLYAIKNSSFVLTNSFHGTAFAVNFNKPFLSFTNNYGSTEKTNFSSRIYDFLDELNLLDRVDNDISVKNIFCIDYNYANKRLNQLKDESIKYIRKIIND